ncbi:recombinase XerD [Aequorivita sp. H23M31]|uniref:Recombinase XerD n=1 Tax=Aequorivita ciconiae TaxID=2494375 RepID=A0A410G4M1_9FLAO|nr:tyrosine-type recombinase/integrase [Aequorivita sp. H23M31]QAA82218.1 recombinase XerD [Aequorivita sp. H23M31]
METQAKYQVIMYRPLPNAGRIKFFIPYPLTEMREAFKKLNTSFYHNNQKLWSIVNTQANLKLTSELFGDLLRIEDLKPIAKMPTVAYSEKIQNELDKNHQKMVLKGFSNSTIRSYQQVLGQFFSYFEKEDYKTISKEQVEGFVYHLISKYNITEQRQNLLISAIKCYFENTLEMPREYYNITRPKKSKDLPNVLSVEEVRNLLTQPKNIKHKAILHIIYAGGLRIGEVIRLRVTDVRSADGYIFIKDSKGKKDRHTVLSTFLLELLREYYKEHKPSYWLFEGQDGGQYSAKSIQNIYRKAVKETKSNPWSTPHTLRHSFATHLMQQGVNIRYIQSALGHSSSKTTEVYTRVLGISNKTLKSPLDTLFE